MKSNYVVKLCKSNQYHDLEDGFTIKSNYLDFKATFYTQAYISTLKHFKFKIKLFISLQTYHKQQKTDQINIVNIIWLFFYLFSSGQKYFSFSISLSLSLYSILCVTLWEHSGNIVTIRSGRKVQKF